MKQMKKIIFAFIIVFITQHVKSQVTEFPADSLLFLKEAQTHLASVDRRDAKAFMEEFALVWATSRFDKEKKKIVYQTSNLILQKRMNAYPEFRNYLESVKIAVETNQSLESFKAWHSIIEQIANGKSKKDFSEYLQGSALLFSDNIIFQSSSTTWKANTANYEFTFDRVPIIKFNNIDLKCYSKGDSSVIIGTKGIYYPLTNSWRGEGGKVTWERANVDPNKIFALVGDYRVNMKSAGFTIDSVELYSPYFLEPILGQLNDKVRSQRSNSEAIYPQFSSYSKRLVVKNVFPDVDYDGGFTLEGASLIGRGSAEEPAKIIFYKDKLPFLEASAQTFTISESKISCLSSKVKINLYTDSITHPGVNFTYIDKDKKVTLVRENEGVGLSPFFNSYHNLDMSFESITWVRNLPYLTFGPMFGSTNKKAKFESDLYFEATRYDALTSSSYNPLVVLRNLAKQLDTNNIPITQFAGALRTIPDDVVQLLIRLSNDGFIYYDIETRIITPRPRLENYILQRAGRKDYDVIQIESEVAGDNNAVLDLEKMDLKIKGVNKVSLSDAQFVRIYPENQELIIQKNRNMLFDGIVNAGRTEFFGRNFYFDYNEFIIDVPEADSLRLRPATRRDGSNPLRLLSKIEEVQGVIYLDDPKNRSGKDTTKHQYPIFKSDKEAYVYYDSPDIQSGAYTRDEFKFVIDKFEIDSLDNFRDHALSLSGNLISAGIFPTIKENLTIQKDYSLGFIKKSPANGYPIYGGKANYKNELSLSHKGLKGNGEINFLTSHATSTDMTFLPESILAIAEKYENKGQKSGPEVPAVKGENVRVNYMPYKETLTAASIRKELNFYEGDSQLKGQLTLTKKGMNGKGTMFLNKAELLSNNFQYKHRKIDADTSAFSIVNTEGGGFTFKSENLVSNIDFDTRIGDFKSNGGENTIEFPENQYICYMEEFKWYMDEQNLELSSKATADTKVESELDLEKPNFISIHPQQDSLAFRSPKARYDLKSREINCEEVEFITVADARISPSDGKVNIKKKAEMQSFTEAQILANYITQYHLMYKANVNIFSRRKYAASGYYRYIDENKREQEIYFANISPDTTFTTSAVGTISEQDKFRLSPNFEYYGQVELKASIKEMTFIGQTRIAHNCTFLPKNWMSFKAPIDPNEIFIPVSGNLTDEFGNPLGAGVTLNTDSVSIYPTFLSLKTGPTHIDILAADGFLFFNKSTREYQISNKEKLRENSLPGNFVSIHAENCQIKGNGKMNLGANIGQVEAIPYGDLKYDNTKQIINATVSLPINFPFNNDALEKMAKQISSFKGLLPVDYSRTAYEKTLREMLGLKKAEELISELNLKGEIKRMPDEIQTSIFLADVKFVWDKQNGSYRSVGKIGVGHILKNQIFKYVDGTIEVKKTRTGDEITIYLKLDENNYYFFQYKKGVMQVHSSNEDFNSTVKETKKEKNKYKGSKGQDDFQYILTTKTRVVQFLNSLE
jgi:hypothetical protein